MKKLTKKAVKTVSVLALSIPVFIVVYLLYGRHETEAPSEDFVRYEDTALQRDDSVTFARLQALIDKEVDSVEHLPTGNLFGLFYNNFISGTEQDTSFVATQGNDSSTQNNKTDVRSNSALQGPSALFTRTYSLAIGKAVPVSILWASDSGRLPTKFQLVTITLNDIADKKAGFTLMDFSAVLLYSQAHYAEYDRISIEDETHSLHIYVLQVRADSVLIEFASYLNDAIVSKLKKSD